MTTEKTSFYFVKLCDAHDGCHAWTEITLNERSDFFIHWIEETDKDGFYFELREEMPISCLACKKKPTSH